MGVREENGKVIKLPVEGNKQIKRKKHKRKFSFFNLLFMFIGIYCIYTIFTQQQVISALDIKIEDVQNEREKVAKLEATLAQDVENIDNQEYFLQVIEKIARNEYKMVKPNEIIYIDKNRANNKFITGIGFGLE